MPTNSLSDHKCKTAAPREKAYKLFDGHGLHLIILPTGGKSWRVAHRVAGKPQTATIGPYPLVTLAAARVKRDEIRLALLSGQPLKSTPAKARLTLKEASAAYWTTRRDVSANYLMNAENAIARHILPALGNLPVADITRADLLPVLMVMDTAGLSVYVRKTRMWLHQLFDWAVEHEHASTNPAALIDTRRAFSKAPVTSFASLELGQAPAFMERLALEGVIQSAIACKLLALTWVRTQELRMMEFSEVDGDVWRIPAGKMKRRRDHMVPLSRQAMELVEHMRQRSRGSKYVFPNDRRQDRPMSENAVLYLIGRIGYGGKMTGHGFRTMGSTWANEGGYTADAIERQLAHAPDDRTRAVYNKAEYLIERRAMLQAWADWLMP
jgi:integrase